MPPGDKETDSGRHQGVPGKGVVYCDVDRSYDQGHDAERQRACEENVQGPGCFFIHGRRAHGLPDRREGVGSHRFVFVHLEREH